MLDIVIRNATVIDGTGAPGRVADVGVRDGRIVAVGDVAETAAEEIDASGLLCTPGFVDPHTHYDAQLHWDPAASPSNIHGVTSIIGGNCGFTLAPLADGDAGWLQEMMAQVEGMPLDSLRDGVDWSWRTFAEYLDTLEGNLGVNAGFLVGHCALRRFVMGTEGTREATDEELAAMVAELRLAIDAGGLGFSSTQSYTHSDGDKLPVPSRNASRAEVLALCAEVAEHEGTTLEFITDGCLNGFSDDEIDLLTEMSRTGQRPLNWNVLTVDSRDPEAYRHQLKASDHAAAHGGRVVALTMPVLVPMNMSFGSHCALHLMPGWAAILKQPLEDAKAALRDPEVRRAMDEAARSEEAGIFRRLTDWDLYRVGDTFTPGTEHHQGRMIGDIATERGLSAFDALVEVVLEDDLRTILWPTPPEDDDESWAMRAELWRSGQAMLGGSDAGAHLDRMLGSTYPTQLLGDCLRGRKLLAVEEAVHLLSDQPARLFGLRERGRVAEGWWADLVLLDPAEIGSGPPRTVHDLPAGGARLFADSYGVRRVLVNGETTVLDGQPTGALPGTVLRSGRDTETVLP